MRFLCKRKDNRGASLVELLIVVTIISIVAVSFFPTYIHYIEKSRVQKWLSELDSFYGTFELSLLEARTKGYEPPKGELILVDDEIHEIWGNSSGTTIERILENCFDEHLDLITNLTVCFDQEGISQYYYIEFVKGSETYKYYNIIEPSFKSILPKDIEKEKLSSSWFLVKE